MTDNAQIARQVFSEIEAANPSLRFERFDEAVEGEQLPRLRVREQSGLSIPIDLYVWSDELYLDCGAFHGSWFPMDDRTVREDYVANVCGLLQGTLRVVEYTRGKRVTRADLQTREGESWRTINRWRLLIWPWPRLKQGAIRINDAAPQRDG